MARWHVRTSRVRKCEGNGGVDNRSGVEVNVRGVAPYRVGHDDGPMPPDSRQRDLSACGVAQDGHVVGAADPVAQPRRTRFRRRPRAGRDPSGSDPGGLGPDGAATPRRGHARGAGVVAGARRRDPEVVRRQDGRFRGVPGARKAEPGPPGDSCLLASARTRRRHGPRPRSDDRLGVAVGADEGANVVVGGVRGLRARSGRGTGKRGSRVLAALRPASGPRVVGQGAATRPDPHRHRAALGRRRRAAHAAVRRRDRAGPHTDDGEPGRGEHLRGRRGGRGAPAAQRQPEWALERASVHEGGAAGRQARPAEPARVTADSAAGRASRLGDRTGRGTGRVLREGGYDVVGDLDDLLPQAGPEGGRRPDEVSDAELADAALVALTAVTEQYARYWWQVRRRDQDSSAGSARGSPAWGARRDTTPG